MFSSGKILFSSFSPDPRYLYTWGYDYLNLDSYMGVINSPRRIGSKNDWRSVAAFRSFSTAVDSKGRLYGWGQIGGSMGSSGHEEDLMKPSTILKEPIPASNMLREWYDGGFDTVSNHGMFLGPGFALGKNKTLFSFGSNRSGLSGTNQIDANDQYCLPSYGLPCKRMNSPVRPVESYKSFVKVGCTSGVAEVAVAVSTDGQLYAWGWDGQLDPQGVMPPHGDSGSLPSRHIISPKRVGSGTQWADVSCGDTFVILLDRQGAMYAARFLSDMPSYIAQPQSIVPSLSSQTTSSNIGMTVYRIGGSKTNWISFCCGRNHVLAIDALGDLYAWGANNRGQLGDGTLSSRNSPTRIGTKSDWLTAAAGESCSFAIDALGHLYAWGDNSASHGTAQRRNLLGTGSQEEFLKTPLMVGDSPGWSGVSAGGAEGIGAFVLATRRD